MRNCPKNECVIIVIYVTGEIKPSFYYPSVEGQKSLGCRGFILQIETAKETPRSAFFGSRDLQNKTKTAKLFDPHKRVIKWRFISEVIYNTLYLGGGFLAFSWSQKWPPRFPTFFFLRTKSRYSSNSSLEKLVVLHFNFWRRTKTEEEEESRVYCYFTFRFLHAVVIISIISRYWLIILYWMIWIIWNSPAASENIVVRLQTAAFLVRCCENTLNMRYWYNVYVLNTVW